MLNFKLTVLISLSAVNAVDIGLYLSNGSNARITEFPFLVSIQQTNVHICGGSLLNEKWVLSSVRCFVSRNINDMVLEYGNSEITPGPTGPNKAKIDKIVMHEDYGVPTNLANDISLIESSIPIETGFHEPFAKLTVPGGATFASGTESTHVGWGHVRLNTRTNVLQKAQSKFLPFDDCVIATNNTRSLSRNNICAIGESVMCAGDLGRLKNIKNLALQ